MRLLFACFVLGTLASLVGCVSVRSNINTDAVPPSFSRVLVVTKMRNAPDSYGQEFARAFPTGYEVCTLMLSPLSFGKPEELIKKQVDECHSDVILTLELVGRYLNSPSSRRSASPYEFNAEMQSVATGQPFWKAIISSDAINGETVPPNAVLYRLIKDHIIQGKLSAQTIH